LHPYIRLPVNAAYPADLFTAALTTPIKTALRHCVVQSRVLSLLVEEVDLLPGTLSDRNSPVGELDWILTAITDSIAWSVLPLDMFRRLYRQDAMLGSLFRNYLLADRILRSLNLTPVVKPAFPRSHEHPMWQLWDATTESFLLQLQKQRHKDPRSMTFAPARFFTQCLTSFRNRLGLDGTQGLNMMNFNMNFSNGNIMNLTKFDAADLPNILQTLLSPLHRRDAVTLLCEFVCKGAWATNLALSVGILPYLQVLLKALDQLPPLICIYARILAVLAVATATASDPFTLISFQRSGHAVGALGAHQVSPSTASVVVALLCVLLNQ
jgi:regulator-associated protein of mTOR